MLPHTPTTQVLISVTKSIGNPLHFDLPLPLLLCSLRSRAHFCSLFVVPGIKPGLYMQGKQSTSEQHHISVDFSCILLVFLYFPHVHKISQYWIISPNTTLQSHSRATNSFQCSEPLLTFLKGLWKLNPSFIDWILVPLLNFCVTLEDGT